MLPQFGCAVQRELVVNGSSFTTDAMGVPVSNCAVPVEEDASSVRAVTFARRSAKDIVSSNIVLVVKTGFEEYRWADLNS